MTSTSRRIACFCETTFDAEIPERADLAADPEIEQLILDGTFMAVTCPACGKRLTPEYPFRLTGVKPWGEVVMVPEVDRVAFLRGALDYVGSPGRVVVGFPELSEKVLLAGAGRDDRVIEIMKYYLLTGSERSEPQESAEEVRVIYRGEEAGRHLFAIMGLREGEVGMARLADELYGRIASDVERRVAEDPFQDFCTPPWVSLRRVTGAEG
ncbi:MAG TPA: CpXC domain-containing protein [Spirochaetia bacterium]|nr:CpXC domain-containing protein [Spirochaetia bacterium]